MAGFVGFGRKRISKLLEQNGVGRCPRVSAPGSGLAGAQNAKPIPKTSSRKPMRHGLTETVWSDTQDMGVSVNVVEEKMRVRVSPVTMSYHAAVTPLPVTPPPVTPPPITLRPSCCRVLRAI
jgi:hypothetical protein